MSGKEEGIKEWEKKNQLEIAERIKTKNMDVNTIMEITQLTKEEIEKI